MQGILLVDKPAGWTSFDVVNYVRRIVANAEGKKPKSVKVGHTGTLDPFATGLLVLLVGKDFTRRAGEWSKADKTYEFTLCLGQTSSTGDPEGVLQQGNTLKPPLKEIEAALPRFTGKIEQTPPAYSAIKINGQRAYKLAHAGKEVIIEPRKITIHRLELTNYSYPEVHLSADVSSGTYIRVLAEDIGRALGTGAYTTALRRIKVNGFELKDALRQKELTAEIIDKSLII